MVAKCWDPTPRGYFTLPRHEQARPVDPLSWLAHTQAVQNTYHNPSQQVLLHHQHPNYRQSILNSTTNMSSTISSTSNTMADNERKFAFRTRRGERKCECHRRFRNGFESDDQFGHGNDRSSDGGA